MARVGKSCPNRWMSALLRVLMAVALVLVVPGLAHADGPVSGSRSKPDSVLVYGQGFMFSVKEPEGWKSDVRSADRIGANIVFYRSRELPSSAAALIRVRVNDKIDENTVGDLQADMDEYRRQYAGVAFEDLAVAHPSYRTFPKVFFVEGEFFEYVVYLNPGKGVPFTMSVSMNKQKSRATRIELQAFQEIVGTLRFFNEVKVTGGRR